MSKNMPCSVARDLLPLHADGLLSPESEALLREHLSGCTACREILGEMCGPEPAPASDGAELDYLKKVRKSRIRLLMGALLAVVLIAAGLFAFFRIRAEQPVVNYDEASKTLVVYSAGKGKDLKLPAQVEEAQNLDAQYDSFHLSVYLPMLRNEDLEMEEYLPAYLQRTEQSLQFLRQYLRENCADVYPSERASKYVELCIQPEEGYSWSEQEDRINLHIGSFYWHREELYILSLLGTRHVQWKELGYAWYLGSCLDPYAEILRTSSWEKIAEQPYSEAYLRLGGTEKMTPENFRRLNDAVSWLCLSKRMYWGTAYESTPLRYTALYKGPTVSTDPGNEMSVCMASSFIAYLADEYGFSAVSGFCFGRQSFEEAFGTDFQSAYETWSSHILEICRPESA